MTSVNGKMIKWTSLMLLWLIGTTGNSAYAGNKDLKPRLVVCTVLIFR